MITLFCIITVLAVFGRLFGFAVRASWGLLKIILSVVFLPLVIIGLILSGVLYIAVPLLIIAGIACIVAPRRYV